MRTELTIKNINRTEILEKTVDANADKVVKRLKRLKEESSHLSVHIEKNPHKEQYYCWLNLYLPSKVVHIKETANTLTKSLSKAFNALLIQIDKYKYKVERHLQKQRKTITLTEE